MFCDLHLHSTASDGTDDPAAIPQLAKDAGLGAIALTDHDTTAGLPSCAAAAKKLGLDFMPGIELSADPDVTGNDNARGTLHLLGYGVRHDDPDLARVQDWLAEARAQRNPQLVENLNRLGVRIDYDEVLAEAGGGVVGRPHVAQVLVRRGYAKTTHEAFTKYIGEGGAAYLRKDRLSAADAINAVHTAGGVACLAHPVQMRLPDADALEHVVAKLVDLGLDGIETRHSDHRPEDFERFTELAVRFNLIATGGSDYHGSRKPIALGACKVPIEVFEKLRAAVE